MTEGVEQFRNQGKCLLNPEYKSFSSATDSTEPWKAGASGGLVRVFEPPLSPQSQSRQRRQSPYEPLNSVRDFSNDDYFGSMRFDTDLSTYRDTLSVKGSARGEASPASVPSLRRDTETGVGRHRGVMTEVVEQLWTEFKGLLNPEHEYQRQGRWVILAVLGSLPIRFSLLVQDEDYGFIWTAWLILLTSGGFIFPGNDPNFLCDDFKNKWTELQRIAWSYALWMHFLTVNTLGTIFDSFSLMFKAFLILENLYTMQGMGSGALHNALALVLMLFASAEVVIPSVGLLVRHEVIPMEYRLDADLALTFVVASGLVCMYVKYQCGTEFRRMQRRFVWAGLWAQLSMSFLSEPFMIGFKFVSVTLLMLAFCSGFF